MEVQHLTPQEIKTAVAALQAGELVAFPTETVYGLGANASNPTAVAKIFALKGRPANHPVIVHLDEMKKLFRWVLEVPPMAQQLAAAFWPGPLTLVLQRGPAVSDVITGGQHSIAVRIPSHPIARQLLSAFGEGIAAPSANRFGHVSPTRAEHVRDEFGDSLKCILDGGECRVGLESTIVSCIDSVPHLLRPGSITLAQLRAVVPSIVASADPAAPRAPGTLARHYAPLTPIQMVPSKRLEQLMCELTATHKKVAVLAQRPPGTANPYMTWINAGLRADQYARMLYANLRTLDKVGAYTILVEAVPGSEQWDAIRDRLQRACTREAEQTTPADDEGDLP